MSEEATLRGRVINVNNLRNFSYYFVRGTDKSYYLLKRKNDESSDRISRGDIIDIKGKKLNRESDGKDYIEIDESRVVSKYVGPQINEEFLDDGSNKFNYLKAMFDPETFNLFDKKFKTLNGIRNFLNNEGFLEVYTPVLSDKPQNTGMLDLKATHRGKSLYLRKIVEPKLRYFAALGFGKIYEIGPIFRGVTSNENLRNEFVNLDLLAPDFSLDDIETLAINLYNFSRESFGLDSAKIARIKFQDTMESNINENQRTQNKFFRSSVMPDLKLPTLVYGFPSSVTPTAKTNPLDKTSALDFRLIADGRSIIHGYTLETDLESFRKKAETNGRNLDDNSFSKNLEETLGFGIPPYSGFGMGIERLIQHLSGRDDIREVYLFGG